MRDYNIVDRVSKSPTFGELEAKAERFGIPLENVMKQEQSRWYAARRLSDGTKKYSYSIVQNPALMTWQSYNGISPVVRILPIPVKKSLVERFFPEAVDEEATAIGGGSW